MAGKEGLTPLDRLIRARIAAQGPMSVYDYMTLCLGHPEHGYYRRREAIGRFGDFITAPEISQVFGELLGLWSAVVGEAIAPSSPLHLIELGPGRGTLMADALRALQVVPGLTGRLCVRLVEPSPALTAVQRHTLEGTTVLPSWHTGIDDVPPGPAILIANEVVDALPVRQLVRRDERWHERVVGLSSDGCLEFQVAAASADISRDLSAPEGCVLEQRPDADRLIAAIARRAAAHPTVALVIDYGHGRTGIGDTLQAVRRHQPADPLMAAGETDLSAQVDFEELTDRARQLGLEVDGPVPQAGFLGALGIVERTERLLRSAPPTQAVALESGALRLIDPSGMGSRFKALGLRTPGIARLPGF
jgi:SAM-dependent MidA family methyltransferase